MSTHKRFGTRKSADPSTITPPPPPAQKSFAKPAAARAPAPIAPHPGSDDDGIARAFPKDLWRGEMGDFLVKSGMTPDNPDNILPTQRSAQATQDTAEADQKRFLETLNAKLPEGVTVIPWAMMPWALWKTDRAPFLQLTCELYPASPWNQFLLPENPQSAAALGLPEHPREYPPGMEIAAQGNLDRIEEEFSTAHKSIELRILAGDANATDGYADLRKAIQWKVMAMANTYASITFGEEAYDRHLMLFGKSLRSPVLDALLAKRQLN